MKIQQLLDAAEPASRYVPAATAELINGLANAVRQLAEQRNVLVVENAGLNSALTAILQPGEATLSRELRATAVAAIEIPATSSAIAALRAEGVDMFAAQERAIAARRKSKGMDDSFIKKLLETAENAEEFAKELRGNKGAQL